MMDFSWFTKYNENIFEHPRTPEDCKEIIEKDLPSIDQINKEYAYVKALYNQGIIKNDCIIYLTREMQVCLKKLIEEYLPKIDETQMYFKRVGCDSYGYISEKIVPYIAYANVGIFGTNVHDYKKYLYEREEEIKAIIRRGNKEKYIIPEVEIITDKIEYYKQNPNYSVTVEYLKHYKYGAYAAGIHYVVRDNKNKPVYIKMIERDRKNHKKRSSSFFLST